MMSISADDPEIATINVVGMRRRGISDSAISLVRQAFKLMYREHKKIEEVRSLLVEKSDGVMPLELMTLLNFVEWTQKGKNGRGREAYRNQPAAESERRAA